MATSKKVHSAAATLVEPGIECFLCCAYFAFALTTLPWFHKTLHIPQTMSAMALIWLLAATAWMLVDWQTFKLLHSGWSVRCGRDSPNLSVAHHRPVECPDEDSGNGFWHGLEEKAWHCRFGRGLFYAERR
ncbi:Ceramide glucosyltransferase [Metarhizium acridum]|nr:Ceramide glucosyltransferase [Metarhizium acridum]